MAKLTKEQNPYGVTIKSVWEARQFSRYGRKFVVKKIVDEIGGYFAECLHDGTGKKTRINLQNFKKYQRIM
jgi:hypothetical protein